MPLAGPSSYVSTLEEFIAHWTLVDAELGVGNEMTLATGPANDVRTVTLADLTALRDSLNTAQDSVQAALNEVEFSRGQVALDKATLLPLAQAFGRKVRGIFPPGSPYLGMLPTMPQLSSGQETFLRPMRDVTDVWQKITDAGTNITLPPAGTDLQDFEEAVETLETRWQDYNSHEVELTYERDKRNALQETADEDLGRYRPTVESLFSPESPLVASIPRLRPLPGHTPDPVSLTAVWDEVEGQARLTWTASTDATLASYQVRMSPSETYEADAESVVATIPQEGPLELLTIDGLPAPASTASYKVYVILDTSNERGSNAETLTRP